MGRATAILSVAMLLSGCARLSPLTTTPPATPCTIAGATTGKWTGVRMTQLGPAWIRLDLRANCTFTYRIQLLWARFTEHGIYKVEPGALVFARETGTMTWPYELVGEKLRLTEAPNETHVLTRSGR